MEVVRSCGVLVFRREPDLAFLVLTHGDRFDLPKGHLDPGESDEECALRELFEETGIPPDAVELDQHYTFESVYYPRYRRIGGRVVEKTVRVYLGWLLRDIPIAVTEHAGHRWVAWSPPHDFRNGTIDGALAAAGKLIAQSGRPV